MVKARLTAEWLIRPFSGSKLVPGGYGESKPVMPDATEEGRAKNRRVEWVKR